MILGTPEYMAPEQAKAQEVGPRTDVYSLGALLYVCLTGRAPFQGVTALDTLAQICDQTPVPPRQLQPGVPRDLETISLKCLAKEPSQRYSSVVELADDLRRFLEGRPILARPIGPLGRTARWARRRPAVAGLLAALVLAVLAALGELVSLWHQQQKTLAERIQAETQRDRADQNLAVARQAVEEYLDKVTDNPRLKQADFHALRKELLESAVPFYEHLVQQQASDPQLAAIQGRACKRLATLRGLLGNYAQALADYQQMEQTFAALIASSPGAPELRRDLAQSKSGQGQMFDRMARNVEAEKAYREALVIQQELVREFPAVPEYRRHLAESYAGLAVALLSQARNGPAEEAYRQSLPVLDALHAEFPQEPAYRYLLAAAHNGLGDLLNRSRHWDQAEQHYRRSIRIKMELSHDFPNVPEYRQILANGHNNLAGTLRNVGRGGDSLEQYEHGVVLYERLTADFPSVPAYRERLAITRSNMGALLAEQHRPADAEKQYRLAIEDAERLVREFPTVPSHQARVALAHSNLGSLQTETGRLSAALESFRHGEGMFEKLAAAYPRLPDYRANWLDARVLGAGVLAQQGDYRSALAIVEPIDERAPVTALNRYNLASAYARISAGVARDPSVNLSEKQRLAEDYAARALAWLAASRAAGLFAGKGNLQMLKDDRTFDSLRDRADFQKFMSQLDAAQAEIR